LFRNATCQTLELLLLGRLLKPSNIFTGTEWSAVQAQESVLTGAILGN
jgi:hypothetical protein